MVRWIAAIPLLQLQFDAKYLAVKENTHEQEAGADERRGSGMSGLCITTA